MRKAINTLDVELMCIYMDCRQMVEERAKVGRGAQSAWLWRHRVNVR